MVSTFTTRGIFDDEQLSISPTLLDLRSGADLLCPPSLFRPAIDTEVIPLLMQLSAWEPPLEHDPVAFKRLHQFIQQALLLDEK